jgi:hypothetical protein
VERSALDWIVHVYHRVPGCQRGLPSSLVEASFAASRLERISLAAQLSQAAPVRLLTSIASGSRFRWRRQLLTYDYECVADFVQH